MQINICPATICLVREEISSPDDRLADSYEHLVLFGKSVPEDKEQPMQQAYRRVHLRGLDPVRTPQAR